MQAISISSLPQQVIMPAFIVFDAYQAVRLKPRSALCFNSG
jgi:hypothetical protein